MIVGKESFRSIDRSLLHQVVKHAGTGGEVRRAHGTRHQFPDRTRELHLFGCDVFDLYLGC